MTWAAMDLPGRVSADGTSCPWPGRRGQQGAVSTSVPSSLVWLEDGTERPFDEAEPVTRTWLEVSSEWSSPSKGDDLSRKPSSPGKLIWV